MTPLRPATRNTLAFDPRKLGVAKGDVVMVHAAVRKLGPIVGGVTTLVQALLDVLGPQGTLVANVDCEPGYDPDEIDTTVAGDYVPAFDKRIARAARAYGIFPEVLRTWPGTVRSDNRVPASRRSAPVRPGCTGTLQQDAASRGSIGSANAYLFTCDGFASNRRRLLEAWHQDHRPSPKRDG